VAAGKLRALKARTCRDGRLRGALAYHQAHTGRWAGRGVQPQNLPRPAKGMRPDLVEALLGELPAALDPLPSPLPAAWVGAAIRQCFAAPKGRSLVVLDYSQIEARALLWLAGDEEGLEVYRSGRDAYCEAAAQLYGEPIKKEDPRRQTGKVAVLASGFGAGPDAVERFAVKSEIDLAAAGTTALAVVEAWRSAHPKIAGWPVGRTWTDELGRERQVRKGGWWKQLEKGAREAIETQGTCGPWKHDGRDLYYVLPSGRPLRYRQAGVALVEKGGKDREAIVYFNAQRGAITPTYSGKLCENLTQAYCRDILAIAIVNLSQHPDRKVVLHTHDEVVIECAEDDAPATLAWAKEIMETTPAWAEGLPIKAEGHHGRRYAK